jgi:uncharacterized protein YndB with AHSA1/START domain
MKWVLMGLGIVAVLAAIVFAIGASLPKEHVATRMARYRQPPEKLWEAITTPEAMTAWRTGLKSVERLPEKDGKPAWVEDAGFGKMPLKVEVFEPPQRIVTRIATAELPFGGTWTYEIAPAGDGATLRITEAGEIRPAFFRFMARFIFGYTSTMETYLKDLGRKFGESVAPEA